jgi:glycosyltransferase involved in cell wall biosynthesis
MLSIRHVIATTGRLPHDPMNEPASGVVWAALSLAREQALEGHNVELWGWNSTRSGWANAGARVTIWTSGIWKWARIARWDLSWLMPLWKHALLAKPVDVLHVHVDPNLLLLSKARVRVLHLQTPVPSPFPPAYQRLLTRANAVVCCSRFVQRRFLERADIDPDRTSVVHNGASSIHFKEGDRQRTRAELDLDERDIVLLYAGAIVPEKGVIHLIRALGELAGKYPRLKLLIAGGARLWDTPNGQDNYKHYENKVRFAADHLPVRFLGAVPKSRMAMIYRASDIVCVPSIWDEPFGMVITEAMAARRPVIASRVGGISEIVVNGKTGLLVSPGNEQALAQAIIDLIERPDQRRLMGEAGQARACTTFDWRISARKLKGVYSWLLPPDGEWMKSRVGSRS